MTKGFLRFVRGNTIALLALFIALGGTTYAATALPNNSVGTKQLKKNAVTNPKIKNGAVTGAKVADNSIKGADVLESSLGKVPAATKADTATNATSATNATNATNAVNATNATTATTATSLPALAWTSLTLQNGWLVYGSGVYGPPSYTKDHEGFVHLSGALNGTAQTSSTFATLPAGFRPTRANNTWLRAAATNGAADPHLVDIYIDSVTGVMNGVNGPGSTAAFVDLEGLSFYAG
jgi:hypothetical protein